MEGKTVTKTASWHRLCRGREFRVEDARVEVIFQEGRRHRVLVEERGDEYLLRAVVVRGRKAQELDGLPLLAWLRNRGTALVGFRIDRGGTLVGESWVPKAGLTAQEFQTYVRALATESDRFEYALTGKDLE